MKRFILIIIILLFSSLAWGADQNIYIDSSATAGGDGSIGSPYNKFENINWTTGGDNSIFDWVAAGGNVFINLKRGRTFTERFGFAQPGVLGHVITLQAYGTGNRPIIDATGEIHGVVAFNKEYIKIKDIEIKNAYESGILMSGTPNGEIDNVYVHHVNGGNGAVSIEGIEIRNGSDNWNISKVTAQYNNNDVENGKIDFVYAHGIRVSKSDNVTITGSNLSYNGQSEGIDARGATFNNCSNGTITDSILNYNGISGAGSGVEGYVADHLTVLRNIIITDGACAEIKRENVRLPPILDHETGFLRWKLRSLVS